MRSFVISSLGLCLFLSGCSVSIASPDTGADGGGGSSDAGADSKAKAQPTLPFKPSNISLKGHDLSAITDVEVSTDCEIDSDQTLGEGLCDGPAVEWIATESDGTTKVHVYAVKSLHVEANAKVTVNGSFGAVVVSFGDLSLLGPLTAAASGDTAGPGGFGQTTLFTAGGGPGGGPAGVEDGMGPSPGTGYTAGISGGGGSYCGLGAMGTQEGDTAGPLTVSPGAATAAYGSADLSPLLAGSSGGAGGLGYPGGGGGAIQLVAGGTFTLGSLAYINVGGGGGEEAGETNAGQESSGGGSGGAILIEATKATISGVLAANGGGGGGLSTSGQDATPDGNAAAGGANNGTPLGGAGGAATTIAGAVGTVAANSAAGAGGGGVGRIRINTLLGKATVSGGTLSPSLSTSCATQGVVAP
jgi:hypothetical protein